MPKLVLKPEGDVIKITNNVDSTILTLKELHYPTKAVPVKCISKPLSRVICKITGQNLSRHYTLLNAENKSILHSHVYLTGMYFNMLITDNRDEEELGFQVIQSEPERTIVPSNVTSCVNNATVITDSNGNVRSYFVIDGNTVSIVPEDKKEAESTIIYTLGKNMCTITCEKPKHPMSRYIPAAMFIFTQVSDMEKVVTKYESKTVHNIKLKGRELVQEFANTGHISSKELFWLSSIRYTYFKQFCDIITAINNLPNGKHYIALIDQQTNLSYAELQGSSHWLYEPADIFIQQAMKYVEMRSHSNITKVEAGWL